MHANGAIPLDLCDCDRCQTARDIAKAASLKRQRALRRAAGEVVEDHEDDESDESEEDEETHGEAEEL